MSLQTGEICEQVIQAQWSPQSKISDVVLILRNLLLEPSTETPVEADIADEYINKKSDFLKKAKEWTKKHAIDKKK